MKCCKPYEHGIIFSFVLTIPRQPGSYNISLAYLLDIVQRYRRVETYRDCCDIVVDDDLDKELSMDLITKLSSWTDHSGDMSGPYHDTKVKCYVQIAEQSQLCLRANSIPDYYEANKQVRLTDSP